MSEAARVCEDVTIDELGEQIMSLAGRLAAATCRWLLMVAEFDRREGFATFGLWSTAQWLSHYCGLAHRTALDHVRVAHALAAFPRLAGEMTAGRLSYSQVRAISRVPHDGEHHVVDDLIEVAQHGTVAQLEAVVRGMRTVERNDATPVLPEEYVRFGRAASSHGVLTSRLEPQRAELVHAAVRDLARAEGISEADALVRMAEIALATVNDAEGTARPLRGDERAAVVVHINAADYVPVDPGARAAERDSPMKPGRPGGRIAGGPGLTREVVDQLMCSARVRAVIHGADGNIRDLGRSRRLVSKKLFAALLARDGHCRHPGCTSRNGLQAHHVIFWRNRGRTDLENLIMLCEAHHHQLHDGIFAIAATEEGEFSFTRADGTPVAAHPQLSRRVLDPEAVGREYQTAPDASRTKWAGERLDRRYAVSVLATRRASAA